MSHWLLNALNEKRSEALKQASRAQIHRELLNADSDLDEELIRSTAEALELAVLDLIMEGVKDDQDKQEELKVAAAEAFRLLRVLPQPDDALNAGMLLLRAGALAVLGDKGSDAARWMKEDEWPTLPVDSDDWRTRNVGNGA